MLLGPIFSVELVTGARRVRYFVLRVVYAGVLLAALSVAYLQTSVAGSGALANATAGFFGAFAVLQVLAVLAIGPAMAAGTVALERQRRTIEYLFRSPLSNAEILLSKLAARLVQMTGLVLAGLPVLALAMMLGGIAPEALLVVMAITASTLAAVTMISIAVSAWAPRAQDAVIRVYLLLLVLLLAPWFLSWLPPLPDKLAWLAWLNDQLVAANPLWVLSHALSAASSREAAAALAMVARMIENQMLGAAAALSVAMLVVRRLHLKRAGNSSQALAATLGILGTYIVLSGCCCSLIGVVGGTVGTILLCTLSISDFDRITGRTHFDLQTFRRGSPFRPQ